MKKNILFSFLFCLCSFISAQDLDLGKICYEYDNDNYILYAKIEKKEYNTLVLSVFNHTQEKEISFNIESKKEFDDLYNYYLSLSDQTKYWLNVIIDNNLPGLVKELSIKTPYMMTSIVTSDTVKPIAMNYTRPSMVYLYNEKGVSRFHFYIKVSDIQTEEKKSMEFDIPLKYLLDFTTKWASKSIREILPEE